MTKRTYTMPDDMSEAVKALVGRAYDTMTTSELEALAEYLDVSTDQTREVIIQELQKGVMKCPRR